MLMNHIRAQANLEAATQAIFQWAGLPGETRIVFTTLSGSAYVIQSSGTGYVLRQLEGDSLAQMFDGLGGLFPRVGRAYTDVKTRQIHFVLKAYGSDEIKKITTGKVAFVRDCSMGHGPSRSYMMEAGA